MLDVELEVLVVRKVGISAWRIYERVGRVARRDVSLVRETHGVRSGGMLAGGVVEMRVTHVIVVRVGINNAVDLAQELYVAEYLVHKVAVNVVEPHEAAVVDIVGIVVVVMLVHEIVESGRRGERRCALARIARICHCVIADPNHPVARDDRRGGRSGRFKDGSVIGVVDHHLLVAWIIAKD
jgi:hypothetical protein